MYDIDNLVGREIQEQYPSTVLPSVASSNLNGSSRILFVTTTH
jgi:hypothetical protein